MKIKVPFNYLPLQFKNLNPYIKQWKLLAKSSEFTLGPFVEKFEKAFSNYLGVKYCISTNNGTDALILCLKSLGVRPGDEVITVTNSFYATAGAIAAVGAKIKFVDTDSRYQINIDMLKKKINKRTKVILPVHWGGASPNMFKILKIARKKSIHVVEDACMGIGAKIKKKRPGTFGIVNAFSMHPLKSLNVMGDGGMVVTNNKKIAMWLRRYRNHGMINRDKVDFWGVNNRLQPFQAVIASKELKNLTKTINKRNVNAKIYDRNLRKIKNVNLPDRPKGYLETFALYMGLFKKRDKLKKYLYMNGIETKVHYPTPLHLQKPGKKLGYRNGSLPISEKQSKELLTLPVHQYLNKDQINYVIKTIKKFYKKYD